MHPCTKSGAGDATSRRGATTPCLFAAHRFAGLPLLALSAALLAGPAFAAEGPAAPADRVAADLKASGERKGAFAFYAVPPMGGVQRHPDIYPEDGAFGEKVRIVAAGGEYEPGSFVVYPFSDLGKTTLTLLPFKGPGGRVFPEGELDLKLVKCWFQNGNGWFSYFGDTGFKLVSELLVNDEELIRVDEAKKANYARLTAKDGTTRHFWINPPRQMNRRYFDHYRAAYNFRPMREEFRDAPSLQPVTLSKGRFTAFFLTAHVAPGTPAGNYEGGVRLADAKGALLGEIPVTLTVLPFDLPAPKRYFDPDKDFYVASYSYITLPFIMEENGGDRELAKRQLEAILADQVRHNQTIHWMYWTPDDEKEFTIATMKKAGMRTDIILDSGLNSRLPMAEIRHAAKKRGEWCDRVLGHRNVYLGFGDEPGANTLLRMRPYFEIFQDVGFHFIIAGANQVFHKAAYVYDWHNNNKDATVDGTTRLWRQVDHAAIANYAQQHVGVENPAYNRRQYGLAPYLSGYGAVCNYAHHLGPYNDDSTGYKPMVFAYGIYDGVLDTLQWEGFREGIDDIRYATLMTSLAREASASPDLRVSQLGRRALQYFASFRRDSDDLDAARLEMANWILRLRQALTRK